jgi:tetratricopeptide (TPR) repeat protein
MKGEFPQVLEFEERALRAYASSPTNLRVYMWILVGSGWTLGILGEFGRGLEKCRLALSAGEAASDASIVSQCLWIMALIFVFQGASDEAIGHAQRAIDVGPTPADRAWPQFVLGWASARRSPEMSIELIEPLERSFRSASHEVMVPWVACALGEAYGCAGRIDEALRILRDGAEFAHRGGMKHWEGCLERLLGEVSLKGSADAFAAAQSHFDAALSLFHICGAQPDVARTYAGLGQLRLRQGKLAEARSALNKAVEISEKLGMVDEPQRVRQIIQQMPAA